jgi:hypothetical protein
MERNFRFNVEESLESLVNTLIDEYIVRHPQHHPDPSGQVHVQRSRVVIDRLLHTLYYVDGRLALVVCYGREGTSYRTKKYETSPRDSDDNSGGLEQDSERSKRRFKEKRRRRRVSALV